VLEVTALWVLCASFFPVRGLFLEEGEIGRTDMSGPAETLKGGALNAAISNGVVGLLGEHLGRGPTRARAIHSGKLVLCVLEDTMTKAERNLALHGKEDFVLEMRHAFQDTMREDLTAVVERLTGRKVVAFLSANHIEPDVAAEVFVLDEPVGETEVAGSSSSQTGLGAERWVDDGGSFSGEALATTD
jgi:uncharacterized protein YbcI